MIPKAERDADKAIVAAATQGTWITAALPTVSPEIRLGSFGPTVGTPRRVPVMVCIQAPGATFGEVATMEATTSWEQHAANAKAAAHAVNRLPAYIADAEETAKRIDGVETVYADACREAEEDLDAKADPWARGYRSALRCMLQALGRQPNAIKAAAIARAK